MNHKVIIKVSRILLLFVLLNVSASFAQAAGIEVSPPRLEVTVAGEPVTSRVEVKNPTPESQVYEVSLSEDNKGVTFHPQRFTLEPNASQTVAVSIDPQEGGRWVGEVEIVGRPASASPEDIGSGVKLPLAITYTNLHPWRIAWYQIGLLIPLLYLFWWSRRRKQRS